MSQQPKQINRLELTRESVEELTEREAEGVEGGRRRACPPETCQTYTCPTWDCP